MMTVNETKENAPSQSASYNLSLIHFFNEQCQYNKQVPINCQCTVRYYESMKVCCVGLTLYLSFRLSNILFYTKIM